MIGTDLIRRHSVNMLIDLLMILIICFSNTIGVCALTDVNNTEAAINTGGINPPESETINVWTHANVSDFEFTVLNQAAYLFTNNNKKYKVQVLPSTSRSIRQQVFSGAATGELPCLLEIDTPYLAELAWPGYIQSLERYVSPDIVDDLLPSVIKQGTYDNRLYALGQFDSGLGLWANRRYLKAANVRIPTVTAPWSLDEFEQVLDALTALEPVEYALSLNLYFGAGEFFPYAFAPIVQGFGGDLIDRKTYRSSTGILDGPQAIKAMSHFQSWFRKGWTRAEFERVDDFERGKTALSWMGHWQYRRYQQALGEDLLLLPLPDFGHGIKTATGSWAWAISRSCHNPQAAGAFLSYLMSPKEILNMTAMNGAIPARRSALAQSPLYGHASVLHTFLQQLEAGMGVPRPQTPDYSIVSKAFEEAVLAIARGNDVHTELSKAARNIDEYIAQNND